MFNFTTQTVYNLISTTGSNKNMYITKGKTPVLRIGNTRFDSDSILDVLVKNPTNEHLASVTFDMSKVLINGENDPAEITARIALYVGLSMNSQDSFYANDLVYKGKPLFVEFTVKKGDDAEVVAKRVKDIATKYILLVAQEKLIDVSITTTAATNEDDATGTVTFTGVNGYQQFKKAVLQKYDPEAKSIDCCSSHGEFIDVIVGVPTMYTISNDVLTLTNNKVTPDNHAVSISNDEVAIAPGIEAFGDYNWIIHNLRLPTAANTNFWAPTRNEMPVPGQVYTQFIVRMAVEREGISGEIVGSKNTSVTTHVLYVAGKVSQNGSAAKLVSDAFFTSTGLNLAASKKKEDADDALADPFVNVD